MVKELKKEKAEKKQEAEELVEGESETVKDKKAHAKKFAKAVKKFNSKVTQSIES